MKGSYILFLEVKKSIEVNVGSLGKIKFKRGIYAYVGSAMNGIEKRVNRHLTLNKEKRGKPRWHIDYLLLNKNVKILKSIFISTKEKSECLVSKLLEKKAVDVIKKFGSTDCNRCLGHLYILSYF